MTGTSRRALALASVILGTCAFAAPPVRADDLFGRHPPHDVLYVGGNIPIAGRNVIFGFHRASDGSLSPLPGSPFATGGTGYFDSSFKLGPFDTDYNFAYDQQDDVLFVPNGGSNDVTGFHVGKDGGLSPIALRPFRTGGVNPLAVAVNGRNLIVVNGDEDPAQPAAGRHPGYGVAHIFPGGFLYDLPGAGVTLADGSAPALALNTPPTGPFVFTEEFLGGTIRSFVQFGLGTLLQLDKATPPQEAVEASQPLPLGMAANPSHQLLYVGLPNVGRVGVYRWSDAGKLAYLGSAANSGTAICWLRVSKDGKWLYTVNSGSNTVSQYDLSDPQAPVEVGHVSVAAGTGNLFSVSLTDDGRFLYVLEENSNAAAGNGSNQVHVLAVDPVTGALSENVAALTKLPVPSNTRVEGLLAY